MDVCSTQMADQATYTAPRTNPHSKTALLTFIARPGRVELTFAQGEDVRAELKALLVEFGNASTVALFKRRAAFAFLERPASTGLRRRERPIQVGGAERRGRRPILRKGSSTRHRGAD